MCGHKSYWRVSFGLGLLTEYGTKLKTFYCNQCYKFFNPEGKRTLTGNIKDFKYFYGDQLEFKTGIALHKVHDVENMMMVVKFRKII